MTRADSAEAIGVVFLCFLPDLTKGGQRNLFNLIARLDRRRFRPVVVTPSEGAAADAFRALGVSVHALSRGSFETRLPRSVAALRRVGNTIAQTWRLRRVLIEERVRIGYADGPDDMQYLWVASRGLGMRTIWHVQTSSPEPRWDARHTRQVDRLVGVSMSARARFDGVSGWRGENFTLIPNGVDLGRFRPGAAAPGARDRLFPGALPDQVLVVCASQIVPVKGMVELVDAVARTPPEVRVAVIGHGDPAYVASLEERARAAGVAERIRFAGFFERVEDLLPAADVFVLPSYAEGLPLAVLEAMASALPVVGTDVAGTRELVSADTGLLVPSHDGAALGRAITELARDADRRRALGAAGRRVVEASFTLERYVVCFEDLFSELGASSRDPRITP